MDELRPPPRARPDATPGPMSNADFRKLLETPRAHGSSGGGMPRQRSEQEAGKPKSRKPPRAKPKQAEDEDDEGPKYRDRAEERRRGINPDYEHAADLATIITGGAQADINALSIEDSKFLGGDVDHTHLVKGLDYALLQKVRGELGADGEEGGEGKTRAAAALAAAREAVGPLKFVTPLGRAAYDAVFRPPRINVAELFQPRRTAFVFELDDAWAGDMPTTLRRSKADCPPDKKSRYDFQTEEEWQQYKSNREMMPKAAYQFGVKVSGGRKQGKDLGKARDQKLNTQLNQIRSMISEKHGDRHTSAFEKEKRGARGGGDAAPAQRSKRLKL